MGAFKSSGLDHTCCTFGFGLIIARRGEIRTFAATSWLWTFVGLLRLDPAAHCSTLFRHSYLLFSSWTVRIAQCAEARSYRNHNLATMNATASAFLV